MTRVGGMVDEPLELPTREVHGSGGQLAGRRNLGLINQVLQDIEVGKRDLFVD